MTVTIEAVYEAGVFKPLQPVPALKESAKVKVLVDAESIVDRQRRERLVLEPEALAELMSNSENDLFES